MEMGWGPETRTQIPRRKGTGDGRTANGGARPMGASNRFRISKCQYFAVTLLKSGISALHEVQVRNFLKKIRDCA